MNSAILGPFMIGTILLLIGFRPRKPWVIYAHMNKMFLKVFLSIELAMGAMFVTMEILFWLQISLGTTLPSWVIGVLPLLATLPGILMMVYVLYWSQPFSHNRTGVKAVDEAVERYKKPNERAVGIIGGWCPDLVVEGKAYKLLSYVSRNKDTVTGMLAFDMQGNIVRDERVMHKIAACMRLAGQCANPDEINTRTAIYSRMDKAGIGVEKVLSKYAAMTSFEEAGANPTQPKQEVKELLGIMKQDFAAYKSYLEKEAEECNRLGGTQAKKIGYESVEELNGLWKANRQWQLELVGEIPAWEQSVKTLKGVVKKHLQPERSKDLLEMLDRVIPEYLDTYEKVKRWKEAGEVEERFAKIQLGEIGIWQSRLEWVDKVNAKGS